MTKEGNAFLMGMFSTIPICAIIMGIFTINININTVRRGKEFIIQNASYACTKTNQLLKDKK